MRIHSNQNETASIRPALKVIAIYSIFRFFTFMLLSYPEVQNSLKTFHSRMVWVWLGSLMLKAKRSYTKSTLTFSTSSHEVTSAEAFPGLILSRALAQLALGSSFITAADRGEDFIIATAR